MERGSAVWKLALVLAPPVAEWPEGATAMMFTLDGARHVTVSRRDAEAFQQDDDDKAEGV